MNLPSNTKQPIFEQIIQYYVNFIDAGVLKPDEKLPSVRDTAIELGVNPNTVARAYEILVEKKYIYSIAKKGYYVQKQYGRSSKKTHKEIKALVDSFAEAINNGVSIEEIRELLNEYEISIKKESENDKDK